MNRLPRNGGTTMTRIKNLNSSFLESTISFYIIFALLLQIIGVDSKGSVYDTLYKAVILSIFAIAIIIYSLKRKLVSLNFFYIVFLFITLQIISIIIADHGSIYSLSIIGYYLIMLSLTVIFLGKGIIQVSQFTILCRNFVIFMLLASLFNFVVNFEDLLGLTLTQTSYNYNFSSFFDSRNTFSYFLYIAIVLNTFLLVYKKNKFFYSISGIFLFINLLLTFSRSSLLALFVFLLIFVLSTAKIKNKIILIYLVALSLILVLINEKVVNLILYIFRPEVGLTGRTQIFDIGFKYFLSNNVLFGSGYVRPLDHLLLFTNNVTYHNTYISILVYGGLLLMSFYTLLLYYIFNNIRLLYRFNKNISMFFLSLMASYLAYSIVEEQLLFFTSVSSFIITILLVLYPKLVLNNYIKGTIK